MKKSFISTGITLMFTPLIAFGAYVAPPRDFKGLVDIFLNIINILVVLIFTLTFIVFMWGIIKGWIVGGGDTEGVENGKQVLLTGVIALVIMSSVWGILYLLRSSLFGG